MSINPKVGDILWVGKNSYNKPIEFSARQVTKVGRKFFTVNIGSERWSIEVRFAIGCKDGACDSDKFESGYRHVVWSSEAAQKEHADRFNAISELRDMFQGYKPTIPDTVTVDDIRGVIRILKGHKL